MAPHKQPISLFDLCLNAVSLMVDGVCNIIAHKYGNWYTVECKSAVCRIQEFLYVLPGSLLDKLHNECVNEGLNFDSRIRLAVYMHHNMKELQIHETYVTHSLFCDDVFWKTKLSYINKIVSLQLFSRCSDRILELIGQCCPNLEYIYFILPVCYSPFIIYYISDFTFAQLEKCKSLKVIKVKHLFTRPVPELKHTCQSLTETPTSRETILQLLIKLPSLECLSIDNIAYGLSDLPSDIKSLKLRTISILDPEVRQILTLSKVYRSLEELSLNFPSVPRDETLRSNVFTTIANSTLQVSSLRLNYICESESFFNFLSIKGKFLDTLTLNIKEISGELILRIGICCPKLKHLYLHQCPASMKLSFDRPATVSTEVMFTNLESLHLSGFIWNRKFIFHRALLNAKSLKDLNLSVYPFRNSDEDDVLNEILKENPLTELRKVHILSSLRFSTVLYLFRLPLIKEMTLAKNARLRVSHFIKLRDEIKNNNLDIVLNTRNVGFIFDH